MSLLTAPVQNAMEYPLLSTVMAPFVLPFDVISIIISLAYDAYGSRALAACALVSHPFHIASRRLIFRQVKLDTGEQLLKLEALLALDAEICPLVQTLVIHPHTAQPVPLESS